MQFTSRLWFLVARCSILLYLLLSFFFALCLRFCPSSCVFRGTLCHSSRYALCRFCRSPGSLYFSAVWLHPLRQIRSSSVISPLASSVGLFTHYTASLLRSMPFNSSVDVQHSSLSYPIFIYGLPLHSVPSVVIRIVVRFSPPSARSGCPSLSPPASAAFLYSDLLTDLLSRHLCDTRHLPPRFAAILLPCDTACFSLMLALTAAFLLTLLLTPLSWFVSFAISSHAFESSYRYGLCASLLLPCLVHMLSPAPPSAFDP